ncbi:hypothetical protein FM038_009970 [Shewanella eurypsychrophilus]|uniref:YCII-related domain-containing protein n=1 Tax=Shewanella eurypsychrophilus TaxID=2593656 RepID=A0ABX6V519_9GAMM|nr:MULTISPECIES: hypothetical protein [Shewanella]QFU22451.1 hypothetical protein FS418_11550 [Shewanella sp. YLB-09]QPG57738.1 hypothetical protein FM038_009970 [Shewanella eurypsychrophilus]
MPQYMLTYLGGEQPATPEEGKLHFAKYKIWLATLGSAMVSPANLLKSTQTVNSDGSVSVGGTTGMSGFTLIDVESMEQALVHAKACPFLEIGGSLEVSELVQVKM